MHPPPLLLLGVVAVESATQCQIVGKIAVCPLDHGVRLFVLDSKHAVVIVPCDLCVCRRRRRRANARRHIQLVRLHFSHQLGDAVHFR